MTDPCDSFPYPELSPLETGQGQPNHAALQLVHKQLNANAMSVLSSGGDGTRGHLAISITAAKYLILTGGVAHDPPVHPGAEPTIINPTGGNVTQVMAIEANRTHAAAIKVHTLYNTVQAKLKQLLLARIPAIYMRRFDDPDYGFANVTLIALLNHLDAVYGIISPSDYTANESKLETQWITTEPIENLWAQTEACAQFDPSIPAHKLV
jgi:hypothetical protein